MCIMIMIARSNYLLLYIYVSKYIRTRCIILMRIFRSQPDTNAGDVRKENEPARYYQRLRGYIYFSSLTARQLIITLFINKKKWVNNFFFSLKKYRIIAFTSFQACYYIPKVKLWMQCIFDIYLCSSFRSYLRTFVNCSNRKQLNTSYFLRGK